MTPSPTFYPRHRGFSLLEILVSLIVLTIMLAVGVGYLSQRSDNLANQAVAQQMQRIGDAVVNYVAADNASLVQTLQSQPGNVMSIPWSDKNFILYLPPGVSNTTSTEVSYPNPLEVSYAGKLHLVSLLNGSTRIDTLIYTVPTTGKPLDVSKNAISIAQMLGTGGFYMDYYNRNKTQNKGQLTYWGSYGQVGNNAFPGFQLSWDPKKDRGTVLYAPFAARLTTTGSAAGSDDYLCRKDKNDPDCKHTMETAINFSGNKASDPKVDSIALENKVLTINNTNGLKITGAGDLILPNNHYAATDPCNFTSDFGKIAIDKYTNQLLTCRKDPTGTATWMPQYSITEGTFTGQDTAAIYLPHEAINDWLCKYIGTCINDSIKPDPTHFRKITIISQETWHMDTGTSNKIALACFIEASRIPYTPIDQFDTSHVVALTEKYNPPHDYPNLSFPFIACSVTFIAVPNQAYSFRYFGGWGHRYAIKIDTIN